MAIYGELADLGEYLTQSMDALLANQAQLEDRIASLEAQISRPGNTTATTTSTQEPTQ